MRKEEQACTPGIDRLLKLFFGFPGRFHILVDR